MDLEARRRARLANDPRLYTFSATEELVELFGDKSYAIVANPKDGFVPLMPRHMTQSLWNELFWRDVRRLVLFGREYKSLCSACGRALLCLDAMSRAGFECRLTNRLFRDLGRD